MARLRRRQGLLAQIEAGALDSRQPLADVLRKCIVLGGHTSSAELRDWARLELDGYCDGAHLPDYRRVTAPLLADGVSGNWRFDHKQVPIEELPEFTREALSEGVAIPMGISQIEKLARKDAATGLQPDRLSSLAYFLNRSDDYAASFERLYYDVSPYAFGGITDAVRTKLVSMVAELRATGVTGDQLPSAAATDRAVQVVIRGINRSPIIINNNHALGAGATAMVNIPRDPSSGSQASSGVPEWLTGPWGFFLGLASLAGTYAGFATGLGWPPF